MAAKVIKTSNKNPIYYGWILLAICLGNVMMAHGVSNAFSVIFVTILSKFDVSRAELSGIFSLYIFIYFCGGAFVGLLLDKIGPRFVIPFGSGLIGLGLIACSRISSPSQLYLYYGLVTSLGVCCVSWLPNSMVITNWFVRRRGMAVGIVMCGGGLGMLVFIPLTQLVVDWVGWRGAFLSIAIIAVLLVAPINGIFQRTRPEDKGVAADGDDSGSIKTKTYLEITETGNRQLWTLSYAIRHPSFWMVCLATFCTPMAAYTIILHQVAFVVDSGFEAMYAASALGFVGIFGMIGRIAGGGLSDRIGREWSYSIFTGSAALAVVFLFLLNPARPWILIIYVVLMGLGMGVGSGLLPPIIADLFPGPSFGRIMGISMIFGGLGASFGSWFAGYLHDITGSYTGGLLLVLLGNAGAITFIWIAAPRRAQKIYTREQK